MKLLNSFLICLLLALSPQLTAQEETQEQVTIEGYAFEEDNRGYLRNVKITLLKKGSQEIYAQGKSNKNGLFVLKVPPAMEFELIAEKKHFFPAEQIVSTVQAKDSSKVFIKVEMERKPGYVFDVTIAEANKAEAIVDAIEGARIEVFNNTTGKEELILKDYPHPNFRFTFEKGNHYTLMIRREGFLNKRIEAYVDVDSCILCFDGLGIVDPGVTDVLAHGHDIGTFLANVELEPAELNKTFEIENIYYDYDKWAIRPDAAAELDKLFTVLNDNPQLIIEMGSHTDSRGRDAYNLNLSQKRAEAAVNYLVENGQLDPSRLTYKGYGETQLSNKCDNGVPCPEEKHQLNRRTELKIVGFTALDPLANKSLKDIITEEYLLKEVMDGEVIKVEATPEGKKKGNE
ncbi:MAG: OmpA family protein [Bacteroidota bacterium]